MPITENNISISISPNPVKGAIGKNTKMLLTFNNNSSTDTAYNLYAELFVPDGVEFISSTQQSDRNILNLDYSQEQIWYNIQNLGPGETFTIETTVKASDNFRRPNKGQVQYNQPLNNLILNATVDTMPRGNENVGNIKINKTFQTSFIPMPYSVQITAPSKIPKGAGTLTPTVREPAWKYNYIITIDNNSIAASTGEVELRLNNGIRYLRVVSVEGPDSAQFNNPIVSLPTQPGLDIEDPYTSLTWNDVNLSRGSTNIITLEAAIWDKYTMNQIQNSGELIPHGQGITAIASFNGTQGLVEGFATVKAMYFIVSKNVVKPTTDVDQQNQYTLSYGVNQYTNIWSGTVQQPFQIIDTIGDGQLYNSDAQVTPTNVQNNVDGTTVLTWDIPTLFPVDGGNPEISKTITYSTNTKPQYTGGVRVKAFDVLKNNVIMNAVITSNNQYASDSSSAQISITTPSITKQFNGYYYKDGTQKTLNAGSPGDLAEFTINYNATSLKAEQGNILVRDFFPTNFSNVPQGATYGGTFTKPGLAPETISPNGIQWSLGNVPGQNNWTVKFKVPIQESRSVQGGTYNLATQLGTNVANKYYNTRATANLLLGIPEVTMTKNVNGPNINNVKSGETYNYTITITNPQNTGNTVTDAFRMTLTDEIPVGLTYTADSITVNGTGSYVNPVVTGQDITMTINKLAPGQNLIITYSVTVDNNVPAGAILKNTASLTVPFSQPTGTYQYPSVPITASTEIKTATILQLTKVASPASTKLGSIVNYILQITVPEGANVSNIQLVDTFPGSTQEFIAGSVTKDRLPLTPQPTPTTGTLTFPSIPSIQATTGPVTITYSFAVNITDAAINDNFIDTQVNSATLTWTDATTGIQGTPVRASANLNVKIPNLTINKSQRNVTKNGVYTINPIQFEGSDTVSYKITVTNEGRATSYNNRITDTISNYFVIDTASINSSKGKATFAGNNLSWIIKGLSVGETATLTFNMTPAQSLPTSLSIANKASALYDANSPNAVKTFGPVESNEVEFNLTNIDFTKVALTRRARIGDEVQYNLTLTVGEGSTIYDVSVYDMLPLSQEYVPGSATKQINSGLIEAVTPTVTTEALGNKVLFPQPIVGTNNNIVATNNSIQVQYVFKAIVKQGLEVPPHSQIQTDNAFVTWDSIGDGSSPQSRQSSDNVQVDTPSITVLKDQKNFTATGTGGVFTKGNILASEGDVIYYRITIESRGASPAYTIQLKDLLSNDVDFVDDVTQPTIGTVVHPNEVINQVLEWNIPALNEGTRAQYIFSIRVRGTAQVGSSFNNTISGTYLSAPTNGKTYNATANTITTLIGGVTATKTANKTTVNLGDEIVYTIEVNILGGVTLHDFQVTDRLNPGQEYIPNSWTTSQGTLGTPVLSNANTTIVYQEPVNPVVAPIGGLTIIYTFKAKVKSSANQIPYSEIQTNIANITWANTPGGTKVTPIVVNENVTINRPNLITTKLQRNVTKGQTTFSALPLKNVAVNDVIEYQLNITNTGTAPAYNVVSTDTLGTNLTFIDEAKPGITNTGQVVTWTVATPINANDTDTVTIQATVGAGFAPGDNIINKFTTNYRSSTVYPVSIGPVSSNEVGFEFTNVMLEKYIVQNSTDRTEITAMIGDEVEYRIVLTVPEGSIAYDVGVEDVLDNNQEYVPNSLTSTGGVAIPPVTATLPNPLANEGNVNATTGEKTIIYNFKARITGVDAGGTEDTQLNTAFVDWRISAGGTSGPTQDTTVSVYVSHVSITIDKTQSIDNITFDKNLVDINIGQKIYYKLIITNPSATLPLYDVNIIDNLPTGFVLQAIESVQSASEIIVDNKSLGSNYLNVIIPTLAADSSSTIVFSAILVGPVTPGGELINSANVTYSTDIDSLNRIYGPVRSNEVISILEEQNIDFTKSSNIINAQLGEVIQYSLNVEIPEGVVIYNAEVEDTLPLGQIYLGEATLNGMPIYMKQDGQKLTSQQIPIIDSSDAPTTLNYTFKARVVSLPGSQLQAIQQNNAWFTWYIDETGLTTTEVTSNTNIIARATNVSLTKLQRNQVAGEIFDDTDIEVTSGDLIEYQLIVENLGDVPAYNVETTDILEQFTTFSRVIVNGLGEVNFNAVNNELKWIIDVLEANQVAILIFEVKVLDGAIAGITESNFADTVFSNNPNDPLVQGPIYSKQLYHKYPDITIDKSSNQTNLVVGSTIKYSLTVTVPKGTKFYNLDVDDILPPEQSYVSSTLNGTPIVPHVNGQIIQFPTIVQAQAGKTNLVYNYEITATIESGNFNVDPVQVQQNSANITWSLDPDDTNSIGPISSVFDVNVIEDHLQIEKLQRNKKNNTPFTKDIIQAYKGEVIEYQVIVNNTGNSTIFLPVIEDVISENAKFLQINSSTTGTVNVENILPGQEGSAKLIWQDISELNAKESIEMIYEVSVIGSKSQNIENTATGTFTITDGGIRFNTLDSNTVTVESLGSLYSFIPDQNSYVSDTEALGYGIVECNGKIGYILSSNYDTPVDFNLQIDAIPFPYKLFINGSFIEEVQSNSIYNDIPELLSGIPKGSSANIELIYNVPEWYNIVNNSIEFNITAEPVGNNDPTTINSTIKLGKVTLTTSYDINEYSENPKKIGRAHV